MTRVRAYPFLLNIIIYTHIERFVKANILFVKYKKIYHLLSQISQSGKHKFEISQQHNIKRNKYNLTSVHCHLAWGEQPSPMMQAWCTSPVWLVWQGTPSSEANGLTDRGFVILRLEVLPFRTSFFFNGLWLFICQAVYGRPNDWQQCWSWGCIKLQKQKLYYFIWFHLFKEEKNCFEYAHSFKIL